MRTFYLLPDHKNRLDVLENAIRFFRALDISGRWKISITTAESVRTLEQNAKLHAMLTDVSRQVQWHGRWLSLENWKDVMTAAMKSLDVVPNIEGNGFVVLGSHTSKMSIARISEMIELIYAFGSEHNVTWSEPDKYGGWHATS